MPRAIHHDGANVGVIYISNNVHCGLGGAGQVTDHVMPSPIGAAAPIHIS